MREMTEDEIFELSTNDKRNESHDEAPQVVMDNEIQLYELHDEVPLVASVIKKYKEIYTDELIEHLFTKNDIRRLNDYMATHDVDEKHLKKVFRSCHDWIRTQMSYDRGRPTYDLFIQDICHCHPELYEELSKLCSDDEYYKIYDAIEGLKCEDDIHDFADNIADRINFVGSLFGFGEDAEESIKNESVLLSCLNARCEFISKGSI